MEQEITTETLTSVLEELSYPTLRPDAAAELRDVTIALGDESENLGALISETGHDSYKTPEELEAELREYLPDATQP